MKTNRPIRVLVADDSAFMRKVISDILSKEPDIEVAGTARNGSDAVRKVRTLQPDVITLDVEMPVMNGLEALQEIMGISPTPVVMVSSLTPEGAEVTLKALATGAVDFICKPSGAISVDMERVAGDLIGKVRLAAAARIPSREPRLPETSCPVPKTSSPAGEQFNLLVIATSTGGPRALQEVIPLLPANFPAPIAIVQHMPKGFTASLAQRLDHLSELTVVEAKDGMPLMPGMAVIAPGDQHLVLEDRKGNLHCQLSDAPQIHSVRPAADPLFISASELLSRRSVGVILTGMGKDGTEGAKALKAKGAFILGESAETAVVFGMPRAAQEAGCVDRLLPLHQIAHELMRIFSGQGGLDG